MIVAGLACEVTFSSAIEANSFFNDQYNLIPPVFSAARF